MRKIKIVAKEKSTVKKLLKLNSFSNRAIKDIIVNKKIRVNGNEICKNDFINKDEFIEILLDEELLDYKPIKGTINIVYEDENIIVLIKPKNITVNSKNQISLANYISYYFKEKNISSKIRYINRLDMGTSGLLMVAKNKYSQSFYQKEIENNKVKKNYLAIVKNKFNKDGIYNVNLKYDEKYKNYYVSKKGDSAITEFKFLKYIKGYSFLNCKIYTGKTHQIRSTLSYLEFPIIGDELYGSDEKINKGFMLFAYKLEFNQFLTNKKIILSYDPKEEIKDLFTKNM
ncbi:MAG: RluA family pseudouridine synthase [Peptoniphilaceae bacterium]|nr:RluA family pseudouridine synthase [Peptoniphilaceae bacterium]MDD7383545.1 RluA family pseudouridine synthase [Peptoniphilaceae bacterium]MDY3738718.1 RluA family pseudouridine synthase [Peptoniphilaceae bacterium]